MVEELKKRTSSFFPIQEVDLPNYGLPSPPVGSISSNFHSESTPRQSIRTPNLLETPSFFSPKGDFTSGILGSSSPAAPLCAPRHPAVSTSVMSFGNLPARAGSSFHSDKRLDTEMSTSFQNLSLSLDFKPVLLDPFLDSWRDPSSTFTSANSTSSNIAISGLASTAPSTRSTLFAGLSTDSVGTILRGSIWSTPKTDEFSTFGPPGLEPQFNFSPYVTPTQPIPLERGRTVVNTKRNIYASKVHTPIFVPGTASSTAATPKDTSSPLELPLQSRRSESSASSNDMRQDVQPKPESPPKKLERSDITLNLGSVDSVHAPTDLLHCNNKHIFENLRLKDYLENFCSTFYKRNTHGYMFIRESSNSLKVNSSGPKSWVTIKLRLGDSPTQKLKVDVKKLNVWKPINLNQPRAPKKKKRDRQSK